MTRRSRQVAALIVTVLMCASCITGVRAGRRCNTAEWGEDGTYALKCEKGRWVRKATKVQVAQLLIAIAKAKQAVVAPSSPPPTTTIPPIPNVLVRNGDQLALPGRGRVVQLTRAGSWYGITYDSGVDGSSTRYAVVLVHLGDGADPAVLSSEELIRTGVPYRPISSADGSKVYVFVHGYTSALWIRGAYFRALGNGDGVCMNASNIVFNWTDPNHGPFTPGPIARTSSVNDTQIIDGGYSSLNTAGCSDNARFLSLNEDFAFWPPLPEREVLYDTASGTFTQVIAAGTGTLALAMTAPTDDGRFVAVTDGTSYQSGIWDRATGTIQVPPGYDPLDVPVQVGQEGTRMIALGDTSPSDPARVQLVQYGPRGPSQLGSPMVAALTQFNPDLLAGLTVSDDGSLRIIHPDWTTSG